jgi:hypothetical protein
MTRGAGDGTFAGTCNEFKLIRQIGRKQWMRHLLGQYHVHGLWRGCHLHHWPQRF